MKTPLGIPASKEPQSNLSSVSPSPQGTPHELLFPVHHNPHQDRSSICVTDPALLILKGFLSYRAPQEDAYQEIVTRYETVGAVGQAFLNA